MDILTLSASPSETPCFDKVTVTNWGGLKNNKRKELQSISKLLITPIVSAGLPSSHVDDRSPMKQVDGPAKLWIPEKPAVSHGL